MAWSLLSACGGKQVCDAAPTRHGGGPIIGCMSYDAGVRVLQAFYTPDQWSPETSPDWGCSFEVDAGVAHFVAHGELCWSVPANDTSDDLYVRQRICPVPPGVNTVVGPVNTVTILAADGGTSCR